jgi:hypothetical protein
VESLSTIKSLAQGRLWSQQTEIAQSVSGIVVGFSLNRFHALARTIGQPTFFALLTVVSRSVSDWIACWCASLDAPALVDQMFVGCSLEGEWHADRHR